MKKTQLSVETLEARLALKLTGELSRSASELPHDISERLRVAREAAIRKRRLETAPKPAFAKAWFASGSAAVLQSGPSSSPGTRWVMGLLPLIALVAGIYFIQHIHAQSQVSAAAEVDVELLADDLPPDAYSDAGFVEFLKRSP